MESSNNAYSLRDEGANEKTLGEGFNDLMFIQN